MNKQILNIKTLSLLAATLMLSPSFSHAGWFSNQPVKTVKAKVSSQVSHTTGKVQDKLGDMTKSTKSMPSSRRAGRSSMP